MCRVKVRTVGVGQHPSEAVVAITTADGKQEELIVDKRSLEGTICKSAIRREAKRASF